MLLLLLLKAVSCVRLCATLTDGSPLGLPSSRILQARTQLYFNFLKDNLIEKKNKIKFSLENYNDLSTLGTE